MARDVRRIVTLCPVCTQSKSSYFPPAGLLRPLPIPSRPWSHIALDFITGLPPTPVPLVGNSVILTVIDCFSKVSHFIPLPTLPSSKETAQAVLDHVFKIHGYDIVSDRGPRFVSQFWREYLEPLSWAEYTYNTLPSPSTVLSPFRCCLGYHPTLFSSQELEASVPIHPSPY